MVVLTVREMSLPASLAIAAILARHWRIWPTASEAANSPVCGSIGNCPETNSSEPVRTACE
jgi:hypothetical protein